MSIPAIRSSNRLPVITGLGVVSAIGVGTDAFWEGVRTGRSGVRPVRAFDTGGFPTKVGCEVDDDFLVEVQDGQNVLPRATRLALAAARQTLADARCAADEVGLLYVGTTMGDLPDLEDRLREDSRTGRVISALRADFGLGLARHLGIGGPGATMLTACSAGNLAIARAADAVELGVADRVLAGGAEAFSHLSFTGFSRMRAMAKTRCTPFAVGRQGMLLGEGAAFLLVEALGAAERRGITPLAAIPGYGLTCDAYHVAMPQGEGALRAMHQALESAEVSADAVDLVCAHGTGTQQNDITEARACVGLLGAHRPPASSIKALIGHALGASSAIEAVACVLSIVHQVLIPQWEVDEQDEACSLHLAGPEDRPMNGSVELVLNNAFAFGGNNSCIALQRPQ